MQVLLDRPIAELNEEDLATLVPDEIKQENHRIQTADKSCGTVSLVYLIEGGLRIGDVQSPFGLSNRKFHVDLQNFGMIKMTSPYQQGHGFLELSDVNTIVISADNRTQ